jgi:hypothetical protein
MQPIGGPFDPVNILVRAMCHHHLSQPKQAKASLQLARDVLGPNEKHISPDQLAVLREAESLIGGKERP